MQNYIISKENNNARQIKKYPRPCKIKKVSTGLELISDFTLNSDNYDIEVLCRKK
jgi:hypothetical protein